VRLAGEYSMTRVTSNFQNHSTRPDLYCVWVPLRDDGRPPLISIWIDSKMTALERKPSQEGTGPAQTSEDVVAEVTEDPKRPTSVDAIGVDSAAEPIPWAERRTYRVPAA